MRIYYLASIITSSCLMHDMGGLEMSGPITGQRIVGTQLTVLESVADKCMDTVSLVRTDVENMRMTRVLGLFRMV
ncbi:hypothetical protein NC653_003493 [Populus alba x Populus x berolinensis]|uniref:Uncharacterized protein n=1 Tax=Populus alba x Populus x berolinensis TaxID=444605 RepID=A0AAD6RRS0_9ROSI|nr:hypothetical protein NC653_003493 [Populus alba x Populus x berolinensis]